MAEFGGTVKACASRLGAYFPSVSSEPPIARAFQKLDRAYFTLYIREYYKFRLKQWPCSPAIGIACILAGAVTLVLWQGITVIAMVLFVIGFQQILGNLTRGRDWIAAQVKAADGQSADAEFYTDYMHVRSPHAEDDVPYAEFTSRILADQGIFLLHPTAGEFYIPWTSIQPPEAVEKLRAHLIG